MPKSGKSCKVYRRYCRKKSKLTASWRRLVSSDLPSPSLVMLLLAASAPRSKRLFGWMAFSASYFQVADFETNPGLRTSKSQLRSKCGLRMGADRDKLTSATISTWLELRARISPPENANPPVGPASRTDTLENCSLALED